MRIIDAIHEKKRQQQIASRLKLYLKTSAKIIEAYKGDEPLANYLKKFFAADKKYGSRDRKSIASLCYYYYRLGQALKNIPVEDRILLGIFLCEQTSHPVLELLKPEWNKIIDKPADEKIAAAEIEFKATDIFPFKNELSEAIEFSSFTESFLIQPDLYLRLRQKRRDGMMQRLQKTGWPYEMKTADCIALQNGSKTEEVFDLDNDAVIQDYNSQQVFNFLLDEKVQQSLKPFRKYELNFRHAQVIKAWDCCAASGGKSILLYDLLNRTVKPTVSDIRLPILLNLHQRFKKAGIRYYDYFIGDLEKNELPEIADSPFPIIVCDAPCTGSGTWGRTPEQLYFFTKETIDDYSRRQKLIAANAIAHLAEGGLFFYITCSVFKKENEEVAEFIQQEFKLQLQQQQLLKGYDKKADSMFVAVFKK